MTVNFVTIHQTKQTDYAVIHIRFPKKGTYDAERFLIESFTTEKAAEVAAEEFAAQTEFAYVPINKSVIVPTSFHGSALYFVNQLTSYGHSKCVGTQTDKQGAINEAAKIANACGLKLLLPK